ncbi:MAG: glycosyltransferase family 4 protein [Bacteroidota bacterium]|nr:glycosyltransferase family 4 protein [Bacteroidota bacterium]
MFLIQKYGGITKYFCELIKNLPENIDYKLPVLFSENQHLKDDFSFFKKPYISLPKNESRIRGRLKQFSYDINKRYSEYVIRAGNYDLFHPTYYDTYFLKSLKKPYIITVHDLIEFKFKDQYKSFSRMDEMETIIKNANRIISISENTKKDLVEILKIPREKIDVVYHGFNKGQRTNMSNKLGKYILFVGVRRGYKNFSRLAKAFSELRREDNELKLICTGQPFIKEELEELKSLDISECTFLFGVNEQQLNELYANALVFVYPSLYEGFGMPILEAFSNECPVCLSNTSSLPEVAGNAGEYFDPCDTESIKHAIQKVIVDEKLAKKMKKAGIKRLENFSWKKCSEETVNSYKKTLS